MREAVRHLFVYGTLRRALRHPMHGVLARQARFVGEGWVRGRLFDLGRYPGVVLAGKAGRAAMPEESRGACAQMGVEEPASAEEMERVRGEVWALPGGQAGAMVLARLDSYEGCDASHPLPHEYRRITTLVHMDDGGRLRAWIYEYALDADGLPVIDGGDYVAWRLRHGQAGGG